MTYTGTHTLRDTSQTADTYKEYCEGQTYPATISLLVDQTSQHIGHRFHWILIPIHISIGIYDHPKWVVDLHPSRRQNSTQSNLQVLSRNSGDSYSFGTLHQLSLENGGVTLQIDTTGERIVSSHLMFLGWIFMVLSLPNIQLCCVYELSQCCYSYWALF